MANNARTTTDLERKYDFKSLFGMAKNVKMNNESITKVNNELLKFIDTTTGHFETLDSQIDGKISTWFYSGEPTLANLPASEWKTEEDKSEHIGDVYYDKLTGYTYIFEYDENYKWIRVKDEDIAAAMSLANSAQDTADNKRQIFMQQPIPPYSCGDLWISSNEIFICQIERLEGNFNSGDWINNLKYTDNTYAQAIVDEIGGTTTEVLSGTVTQYTKNWVKFTDLATGGSTTINGSNIKTGTIDTDNVTIGNGNVLMNKEGIKLKNGAKVIGENGLMNTYLFTNNTGFEICGYEGDDQFGGAETTVHRKGVKLLFNIPEGLNIVSAKLILHHAPVEWSWVDDIEGPGWNIGYSRELKVYKADNVNSRHYSAGYLSEYFKTTDSIYSEITDALGQNGWTPQSAYLQITESKISEDIKDKLTIGLNELLIQPGQEITTPLSPGFICAKTGFINVMLKIDGYMSY